MTAQLASWSSSINEIDYTLIEQEGTLIEQSQYFQDSVGANPSKLGTISFASDLWSDILHTR